MDWNSFPNFSKEEFDCKCGCGTNEIDLNLVFKIQELRTKYSKGLTISSGYRCPKHPNEIKRTREGRKGSHTLGKAVDIKCSGAEALNILELALESKNFKGIGINQKGNGRFLHLDIVEEELPRPTIWSY